MASLESNEVTLGERAQALCERLGIPEAAVKQARAAAGSSWEQGREYVIVRGRFPGGGEVLLKCLPDRPSHVLTFRPVDG